MRSTARLAEEETRGIARAARRAGGRRLDEDLAIDPFLRAAADAALAEATRAYVVGVEAVEALATERGSLVVSERTDGPLPAEARGAAIREALAVAGGGTLDVAVRRDATGAARRILSRAAWLPDLAACLAIQATLPPGWIAVPRDGAAVVTETGVTFGAGESVLERRAESTRLTGEAEALEAEAARARGVAVRMAAAAQEAADAAELARAEESRAGGVRRAAEDAERLAARQLETVVREASWHEAQLERLEAELTRARVSTETGAPESEPSSDEVGADVGPGEAAGDGAAGGALAAWETRAVELRARRDRLTEEVSSRDATRRGAENRRVRAEASTAMAEERVARADRDLATLGERERTLAEERDALRAEIAATTAGEAAAREALAEIDAADADDRGRLANAEAGAMAARERLRTADAGLRAADHVELEMRLGLDALHEAVVVELAGLGELGTARLAALVGTTAPQTDDANGSKPAPGRAGMADGVDGRDGPPRRDDDMISDEVLALESALALVTPIWAAEAPVAPAPSSARLGQLRRRFHELGAVNPYAVDEYASLKERLETLETQAMDLRIAITRTRDLIAELDTMIADRFRTTFRALEAAFATRFEQLFGGGFAKLSLTDPSDLGATGIDIVARPPGKKAQALAMLSGGERALTAVALLFAMLEVRPVPFCVLDEVDAALDEANIGRFADALRSLAHGTQFIVITHNRGTIEAADALYGVTVGDDSVSRVISLRLDEAQALAARDRGEALVTG